MTTDAIHYLTACIKCAWQKNEVVLVLFLDVKGAFPNAVTDRLIHNLKKRRIPSIYITFIKQLLTDVAPGSSSMISPPKLSVF